ncbi:MAG TPA: CPBP family intramembrane glutamic endopeptidase [Pirellulaceae bacterium]|nr:CPBP family intramembrane glutamic endopeptidase [Pirellulaceae bacterium]
MALATEGGLVALALLIASWWGHNLWGSIQWSAAAWEANLTAIGQGAIATIPLLFLLLFVDRCPAWFLQPLKRSVDQQVVPLFAQTNVAEFGLISIAAGFGEELFFRGLIQAGLLAELQAADLLEPRYALLISIGVASIIFGLCHCLNIDYAILATLSGIYLGVLFVCTDNLLAPITAHILYDFFALCYLVMWRKKRARPAFPS